MNLSRRKFLRSSLVTAGALAVLTAGYGFGVEPRWIEITHTLIPLKHMSDPFNGFRIIHLSDIHFGQFLGEDQLKKLVVLVNELQGDLIVHTGDFVYDPAAVINRGSGNGQSPIAEELYSACIPQLAEMRSRFGNIAVLGNQDYYVGSESALSHMEKNGIDVLMNEHRVIHAGEASITIGGLDDKTEGLPDFNAVFVGAPSTSVSPRIMLSHSPDMADHKLAEQSGIQLMLSGHTHGGQVSLPGLPPPFIPVSNKDYAEGLVETEWGFVYINRGIGCSMPPIRLFTRPEVAVIELVPSAE